MSYFNDDDDGGMVYGQVDDATLQQVEAIVNEDVEMLVSQSLLALRSRDSIVLMYMFSRYRLLRRICSISS